MTRRFLALPDLVSSSLKGRPGEEHHALLGAGVWLKKVKVLVVDVIGSVVGFSG
jgi:hypothetical protein